jgi:hypothetical protein
LFREELAKGLFSGIVGAGEKVVEGFFSLKDISNWHSEGCTQRGRATDRSYESHGMMDSAWAHAALHHLETSAGTKDDAGCWNANIVEVKMAMSMWGVIIAVH